MSEVKEVKKFDKRLLPAKIIGIIYFSLSIYGFSTCLTGSFFMFITRLFNNNNGEFNQLPGLISWIFTHYSEIFLFIALFWAIVFIGARNLLRFKEWARKYMISVLVIMIISAFTPIIILLFFSGVPLIIFLFLLIISLNFAVPHCIAFFFLNKENTEEAFADYNNN